MSRSSLCLSAAPPDAPAAPSFSAVTSSSLTATWTQPALNGGTLTSYQLQINGGTYGSFTTVYTGTALTFGVTGLAATTAYSLRVVITTSGGTATGTAAPVTTARESVAVCV